MLGRNVFKDFVRRRRIGPEPGQGANVRSRILVTKESFLEVVRERQRKEAAEIDKVRDEEGVWHIFDAGASQLGQGLLGVEDRIGIGGDQVETQEFGDRYLTQSTTAEGVREGVVEREDELANELFLQQLVALHHLNRVVGVGVRRLEVAMRRKNRREKLTKNQRDTKTLRADVRRREEDRREEEERSRGHIEVESEGGVGEVAALDQALTRVGARR
jgi:hypothetical protein